MVSKTTEQIYSESKTHKITISNSNSGKITKEFPSTYVISLSNPIKWENKNTGKTVEYRKGALDSVLVEEV